MVLDAAVCVHKLHSTDKTFNKCDLIVSVCRADHEQRVGLEMLQNVNGFWYICPTGKLITQLVESIRQ